MSIAAQYCYYYLIIIEDLRLVDVTRTTTHFHGNAIQQVLHWTNKISHYINSFLMDSVDVADFLTLRVVDGFFLR